MKMQTAAEFFAQDWGLHPYLLPNKGHSPSFIGTWLLPALCPTSLPLFLSCQNGPEGLFCISHHRQHLILSQHTSVRSNAW